MARTLTSSDRSALIRLAASLPKGSEERRAILAGLKTAGGDYLEDYVDFLAKQFPQLEDTAAAGYLGRLKDGKVLLLYAEGGKVNLIVEGDRLRDEVTLREHVPSDIKTLAFHLRR